MKVMIRTFTELDKYLVRKENCSFYFLGVNSISNLEKEYQVHIRKLPIHWEYQIVDLWKTTQFANTKWELIELIKKIMTEKWFKEKVVDINTSFDWFSNDKIEKFINFTKENLYNDFIKSIKESEVFYSSSQKIDDYIIESFSYRLASWSDFHQDNIKKEMRWIAFIKDQLGKAKLFTIWFHKFFNYWEGEGENSTVNILKREEIVSIDDKLDGSLILVWRLPDWKLIAKSKTSINSDQAVKSTELINKNKNLSAFIHLLLDQELFPIFEYVWPDNRIVLSYDKSDLILTWVRRAKNGTYLNRNEILKVSSIVVPELKLSESHSINFEEVLKKQENDKWYEWFVVSFKNWDKMKVKLKSYVQLHHTKDEVNNIKRIIEMALDENLDDLRTLFVEDENILNYISRVEQEVFNYYNHIVKTVENAYETTKNLERKDFAIYHKQHTPDYFGLVMQKYISVKEWKEWLPDYKSFVKQTINLKHLQLQEENKDEN